MATGMTAKKATSMGAICAVVCCLICCGLPGLIGLVALNNTIGTWPTVDATVVSTRICDSAGTGSSDSYQEPTYYIKYNYTTIEGKQITSETDYCINMNNPKVGETDQIMYDPDDPTIIFQEDVLDIFYSITKAATGVGFGFGAIACAVAVFMCMQPDPPANPATYQTNNYETNNTYENNNAYNNEYGSSSVPATGPAGDIPTPSATAVPMTPAVVYNGASSTPTSSGPVTYYK